MDKVVKARKKWRCHNCGGLIRPGQYYRFGSYRDPKYRTEGIHIVEQIGIEYVKYQLCLKCDEALSTDGKGES